MGRFSTAASSEVRASRRYFVPGHFKVRITEVEAFDADGVLGVAVKCEVLSTSTSEIEVGEIRQVSWPVSKKKHPGAQFFKTFIAAAMGKDTKGDTTTTEEWEKICELVVSSKQPLTGKIMLASVTQVRADNGEPMVTKKGEPYCNVDWRLSKAEAA